MNNPSVVCVGVITMDTIARVSRYPTEDERVEAKDLIRAIGGPAAVAAIALARLGITVALVGTIGDDSDGGSVLSLLSAEGVNTEGISVGAEPTGGSVIIASAEHNTRAICTRQRPNQLGPAPTAQDMAKNADWVHTDHVGVALLEKLGIRRGGGPKISFDAGYDIGNFDASRVDLFAPNDKSLLSRHPMREIEAAIQMEAEDSGNLTVATRGKDGSIGYSTKSGLVTAKSYQIPILSTLGAGDVFHGALIAQLIENRELPEALNRANAVAALSCRGLDGSSAIPTKVELDTFMTGAS